MENLALTTFYGIGGILVLYILFIFEINKMLEGDAKKSANKIANHIFSLVVVIWVAFNAITFILSSPLNNSYVPLIKISDGSEGTNENPPLFNVIIDNKQKIKEKEQEVFDDFEEYDNKNEEEYEEFLKKQLEGC